MNSLFYLNSKFQFIQQTKISLHPSKNQQKLEMIIKQAQIMRLTQGWIKEMITEMNKSSFFKLCRSC